MRRAAHTRLALTDELLTRLIRSRPVPRELVVDVLRANASYEPGSPVSEAHRRHIRDLRFPSRRRIPTAEVTGAVFHSSDPWSRRVPTVVDELETLVVQVQELHRLADEITRVSEKPGKGEPIRSD